MSHSDRLPCEACSPGIGHNEPEPKRRFAGLFEERFALFDLIVAIVVVQIVAAVVREIFR